MLGRSYSWAWSLGQSTNPGLVRELNQHGLLRFAVRLKLYTTLYSASLATQA